MATQPLHPGVHIEEFTPGAPIQGVGTSTAAFIGTALKGPTGKPTLIQSWDAFVRDFGGFGAELQESYLAPGVYGFFLNGGTNCYIVRVSTGAQAWANLASRVPPDDGTAVLVARTHKEGPGQSITIEIKESSLLEKMLADSSQSAEPPATPHLSLWWEEKNIVTVSDNRQMLTLEGEHTFKAGDRAILSKGKTATTVTIKQVRDNTLTLAEALSGDTDFTGSTIHTGDLQPGELELRVEVPEKLHLDQALPRGTTIKITIGTASEIHTVESAVNGIIKLRQGLSKKYKLTGDAARTVESLEFDITIEDGENGEEIFPFLSMNADHPNYWGSQVRSRLLTLEEPETPPRPTPDDPRPVAQSYPLTNGGIDNRAQAWADFQTDPNKYLNLLKPYDDVALLCVPGACDPVIQHAMLDHCETMQDRVAILDTFLGVEPTDPQLTTQVATVRGRNKGFSALYYPWILTRNPLTGKDEYWPPSGHIAGIFAHTDAQQGVHKAPANVSIRGALGLVQRLTNEEQARLNDNGINVLRVFAGQTQPLIWGARTTAQDANWRYINIRRLLNYIEESIEEGIRWAVFEPNNLQLWQKLKRTITEFLTRVWRAGALFGSSPQEAFYVRIDEVLNPPDTQQLGQLYIEIGVRPAYTVEFITVRIGLSPDGAQVSEG